VRLLALRSDLKKIGNSYLNSYKTIAFCGYPTASQPRAIFSLYLFYHTYFYTYHTHNTTSPTTRANTSHARQNHEFLYNIDWQ
jgi:hypothetical protein